MSNYYRNDYEKTRYELEHTENERRRRQLKDEAERKSKKKEEADNLIISASVLNTLL